MTRKPLDPGAAMAQGVDKLLREFKGLRTLPPSEEPSTTTGGTGNFTGPIEPSVLVASADASVALKAVADYVCDGVDDQIEIQAAADFVNASASGNGVVLMTDGYFYVSENIILPLGVALRGNDVQTTIIQAVASANWDTSKAVIECVGTGTTATAVSVQHMTIDVPDFANPIPVSALTLDNATARFVTIHWDNTQSSAVAGLYLKRTGKAFVVAVIVDSGLSNLDGCVINDDYVSLNDSYVQGGARSLTTSGSYLKMHSTHVYQAVIGSSLSTFDQCTFKSNGLSAYSCVEITGDGNLFADNIITNDPAQTGDQALKISGDDNLILGTLADDTHTVNSLEIASGATDNIIGFNAWGSGYTDSGTGTIFPLVSPLTTKGDLFGFDTDDNRLPVGTDTHVLTADSGETLGVKWAAASGGGLDLTTKGDIHTYDTDDARLGIGSDTQVLTADSGETTGLKWTDASGGTAHTVSAVEPVTPGTGDVWVNPSFSSGGASAAVSAVRAIRTTAKELANDTYWTIDWDSAEYEENEWWSSGDPTVLTVPADGIYHIVGAIAFQETMPDNKVIMVVDVDASQGIYLETSVGSSTNWVGYQITGTLELTAGEEVTLRVKQVRGTDATVDTGSSRTALSIFLVGGGGGGGSTTEMDYTTLTDTTTSSNDTWEQWGTEELRFTEFDGLSVTVKADLAGHIKDFIGTSNARQTRLQISLDDGSTWSDSHAPELKAAGAGGDTYTRWYTGATFALSGTVTTAIRVRAMHYEATSTVSTWSSGAITAIVVA